MTATKLTFKDKVAVARDFDRFCDECVYHFDKRTRRRSLLKRYGCQTEVSDLLVKGEWFVCLKPRQIGITTILAVFCAWCLVTKPNFQILVMQQNRDYAKDFLQRVRYIHRWLPKWLQIPITADSRFEVSFDHGPGQHSSLRVVAGDKGSGRSTTPDLIIFDEHAYITLAKEARQGCEPTLEHSGGQIV
ncbi:MAG: terminase family protein, partial [Roseateles sp.]